MNYYSTRLANYEIIVNFGGQVFVGQSAVCGESEPFSSLLRLLRMMNETCPYGGFSVFMISLNTFDVKWF